MERAGENETHRVFKKALSHMKPNSVTAAVDRPNRLLVALAAAWMILSLAIGGAVSADSSPDSATSTSITGTTSQP